MAKHEDILQFLFDDINSACYNPNHPDYEAHHEVGAEVYFADFRRFKFWSLSSGYKPGLILARKNERGGYSSSNCFWVKP